MPRIKVTFRTYVEMERPARPFRALIPAVYEAFSRFSEMIYPEVIAACPKITYDPRRRPGWVASHIKLMWTTGKGGIRFRCIGVPGGSVKGSDAYHALMAIYSLEKGWKTGITYGPVSKQAMTFPLKGGQSFRNPKVAAIPPWSRGRRGRKPAKTWVITKKVTHLPGQYKARNPFITRVFKSHYRDLLSLFKEAKRVLRRRKKVVYRGY